MCKKFFVGTASVDFGLTCLRRLHLSLRAGGLASQVGIIELQEQLTLANMVSFFYQ